MAYQKDLERHPGIETIQTIMAYFRLHKLKTKLIGTNFRKVSQQQQFSVSLGEQAQQQHARGAST